MKKKWKNVARFFSLALAAMLAFSACGKVTVPPDEGGEKEDPPIVRPPELPEWEDYTEPSEEKKAYGEITANITAEPKTAFTLPVTAEETGVYEIGFKLSAENSWIELCVQNAAFPYMNTVNRALVANVDADGYLDYLFSAYLEKGSNTLLITSSHAAEVASVRYALTTKTEAIAYFEDTQTYTNPDTGVKNYRLVQVNDGPNTVRTTMTVAEDGFYRLSAFAAGVNSAEMFVTVTDGNGLSVSLSADWFEMYNSSRKWENQHYIWYADKLYRAPEHMEDKFKFESDEEFFFTAGEYTVTATAERYETNSQVMFGGGIFLTATDRTCDHQYEETEHRPVSCAENGGDIYTCKLCHHQKMENVEIGGHTYYATTLQSGQSATCTRCGLTETNLSGVTSVSVPNANGGTGSYGNAGYDSSMRAEFTMTAEKEGLYRVYLSYDALTAPVSTSVAIQNTDERIPLAVTINALLPVCTGAQAGYANGEGRYSDNFLYVYLFKGENTLAVHTAKCSELHMKGMLSELVEEAPAYAYFGDTGFNMADVTDNKYVYGTLADSSASGNSGYVGLGIDLNVLTMNNSTKFKTPPTSQSATLHIEKSGWYDLSFAGAAGSKGEFFLTLTKGEETIELRTDGAESQEGTDGPNHKMLISHELYVYTGYGKEHISDVRGDTFDVAVGGTKGEHLVYLEEGDWTARMATKRIQSNSYAFFGGMVFASLSDETPCEHAFDLIESVTATCISKGYDLLVCTKCGTVKMDNIVMGGHTYQEETLQSGQSVTCERCGLTEVYLPDVTSTSVPNANGGTGSYGNAGYDSAMKAEFTVNVAKEGLYKVYLSYEALTAPISTSAALRNTDERISLAVTLNALTASCTGIEAGYANGDGKYTENYLYAYLFAGENTLSVHTAKCTALHLKGVLLELEEETSSYAYFGDTGHNMADVTDNKWVFGTLADSSASGNSGYVGLGIDLNVLTMSNSKFITSPTAQSSTLHIGANGWYDLSFAGAAGSKGEFFVTLSKGAETIELRTDGAESQEGTDGPNHRMLLSHELYVYTGYDTERITDVRGDEFDLATGGIKGKHLVYLEAGDWTVRMATKRIQSNSYAFFGGMIFATLTDETPCEHAFDLVTHVPVTCTTAGYDLLVCTKCGVVKVDNVETAGHSYKDDTLTEGEQAVCTRCGAIEANVTAKSVSTEAPGSVNGFKPTAGNKRTGRYGEYENYQKTTFGITAPKAGVYAVYLAYDATTASSVAILNTNEAVKYMLSFEELAASNTEIPVHYLGASYEGYSRYCVYVYLFEGQNTLELHTAEISPITLHGVYLEPCKLTDTFAYIMNEKGLEDRTDDNGNICGTKQGSTRYGLGVSLDVIAMSGYKALVSEGTLEIKEDGWYDLSYIGGTPNVGEIYLTLTKGGSKIELRSEGLNSSAKAARLPHLPLQDNLYVYTDGTYKTENDRDGGTFEYFSGGTKGNHLVWLDAGEWNARVVGLDEEKAYEMVIWGGGLFAVKEEGEPCEHDFRQISSSEASCTGDGQTVELCDACGTYHVTTERGGHTYRDETLQKESSATCTRCGVTETNLSGVTSVSVPNADGGTGSYGNAGYDSAMKAEFKVNVPKEGLYKVYLSYEALTTPISVSAALRNTDARIELATTINVLSATCNGVSAGYANGEGRYTANYLYAYLFEGENTLAVHTAKCSELHLKGALLELIEEAPSYAYFGDTGNNMADITDNKWVFGTNTGASGNSGYVGLGIDLNVLVMSNPTKFKTPPTSQSSTLHIEESGWYDLSFAGAAGNSGEFFFTLTKDEETIEMRTDGAGGETQETYGTGHKMLVTHELYTYTGCTTEHITEVRGEEFDIATGGTKGDHLVYLEAGDWTVRLASKRSTNSSFVYFGGMLFAALTQPEEG